MIKTVINFLFGKKENQRKTAMRIEVIKTMSIETIKAQKEIIKVEALEIKELKKSMNDDFRNNRISSANSKMHRLRIVTQRFAKRHAAYSVLKGWKRPSLATKYEDQVVYLLNFFRSEDIEPSTLIMFLGSL